ncbi:MAG: hypothetical protein WAT79_06810 [Saprospiraceae bacterium]
MVSQKIDLIRQKMENILSRIVDMESERANLFERIRVLEEELKIQRSGQQLVKEKQEDDQHLETVKPLTLFGDVTKKDLKNTIEGFIEEIDQCIEIIEKK